MDAVIRRRNGVIVERTVNGVDQLATGLGDKIEHVAKPWPLALFPLKLLAQETDRGAGDIIARTIGPIGGDAFKVWYKRLFGKSCGCGARQEALNQRWPL